MTVSRREQWLGYGVLAAFTIAALYPMLSILLLAFHRKSDLVTGFSIPDHLSFDTFSRAWSEGGFDHGLVNSFIVAASVALVTAVLATPAGYAFGTMRFRGSSALFYLLLIGLIFPYEATVIPLYYVFNDAGITDTLWALILPQAWPAITTMLVLVFMWTWNEFLLALVMIQSDDLRTAPLGLALFQGANRNSQDVTLVAAAAVLVALPIVLVYVFLQRSFIRGMFAGAVKE